MQKGFTLLELVVVIIIIAVLASLAFSQYTKIVEKGRGAEARTNLGLMRKLSLEYFFKSGTFVGITPADVGIGSDFPSSCTSTNYFYYTLGGYISSVGCDLIACRCTSGGKPPQAAVTGTLIYMVRTGTGDGFTFWQAGECGCTSCTPTY